MSDEQEQTQRILAQVTVNMMLQERDDVALEVTLVATSVEDARERALQLAARLQLPIMSAHVVTQVKGSERA